MAGRTDNLVAVERDMMKLVDETMKAEEDVRNRKEERDRLEEEIKQLTKKKEKMERELDRNTSSSRDARKMYGDMTPGDITHQDVTLAYQNYFKEAIRILSKESKESKDKKYEEWTKVALAFKEIYDLNKDAIIKIIDKKLQDALLATTPLDEDTFDFCRAFKFLLKETQPDSFFQQIQEELISEGHDKKAEFYTELAFRIIKVVEPQCYGMFVDEIKESKPPANPSARANPNTRANPSAKKDETKNYAAAAKRKFSEHQRPHKCERCHKPIHDNSFLGIGTLFGSPKSYCNDCLCAGCKKPLEVRDESLETEVGLFHAACLVCLKCHKLKKEMIPVDRGFLCRDCHMLERSGQSQFYVHN